MLEDSGDELKKKNGKISEQREPNPYTDWFIGILILAFYNPHIV